MPLFAFPDQSGDALRQPDLSQMDFQPFGNHPILVRTLMNLS